MNLMTHKITLLPGDGIGPEVANAATQIVEASGVSVEWEVYAAPLEDGKRVGEFPREMAVESVRRTHVALKGPMATAVAQGPPSINVALRKELESLRQPCGRCVMLPGLRHDGRAWIW